MANIEWMYDNKLESADRIQPVNPVLSGGTANLFDFDLNTKYMGSCEGGTHDLVIYFNGTGIRCNALVFTNENSMTGTVFLWWGTNLSGEWQRVRVRILPNGTTFFTWAGTVVYVKQFYFRWALNPFNDVTVNELFLGKYLQLSDNPVYPYGMARQENISVTETKKGVRHSYHNFTRKAYSLNYEGITDTDKESIESMLDTCGGGYKPLWYCEDPTNHPEETMFVRFAAETYTFQEVISGVWNVTLPIEEEL